MIVDDDPSFLYTLERILKKKGFEVETASSGEECIARIDEYNPEIILLDIMMPYMDGFQTLKKIKSRGEWDSIHVVMLTAQDDESSIIRAIEMGASDYFTKPYSMEILTAKINSILKSIEMESQILEYSKELEQKVEQRTRELNVYNLELVRSNRLKDTFIDIVRHDLMNLITIVRGFNEAQFLNIPPDRKKTALEKSLKNIDKLICIIENASMLARIEESGELETENLELETMILDIISEFKTDENSDFTFTANVPENLSIKANPIIRNVFSNLISNAMKYSPEGKKIEICAEEKGNSIVVMVKDRGEGIPDEYKSTIFKRFARIKRNGIKGTGLGLAIATRVMELHGGRIWVKDNKTVTEDGPGLNCEKIQGTVFVVELPK